MFRVFAAARARDRDRGREKGRMDVGRIVIWNRERSYGCAVLNEFKIEVEKAQVQEYGVQTAEQGKKESTT